MSRETAPCLAAAESPSGGEPAGPAATGRRRQRSTRGPGASRQFLDQRTVGHVLARGAQARKIVAPARIHRVRLREVTLVHRLDIGIVSGRQRSGRQHRFGFGHRVPFGSRGGLDPDIRFRKKWPGSLSKSGGPGSKPANLSTVRHFRLTAGLQSGSFCQAVAVRRGPTRWSPNVLLAQSHPDRRGGPAACRMVAARWDTADHRKRSHAPGGGDLGGAPRRGRRTSGRRAIRHPGARARDHGDRGGPDRVADAGRRRGQSTARP